MKALAEAFTLILFLLGALVALGCIVLAVWPGHLTGGQKAIALGGAAGGAWLAWECRAAMQGDE